MSLYIAVLELSINVQTLLDHLFPTLLWLALMYTLVPLVTISSLSLSLIHDVIPIND